MLEVKQESKYPGPLPGGCRLASKAPRAPHWSVSYLLARREGATGRVWAVSRLNHGRIPPRFPSKSIIGLQHLIWSWGFGHSKIPPLRVAGHHHVRSAVALGLARRQPGKEVPTIGKRRSQGGFSISIADARSTATVRPSTHTHTPLLVLFGILRNHEICLGRARSGAHRQTCTNCTLPSRNQM
jgi:hypothetical protein